MKMVITKMSVAPVASAAAATVSPESRRRAGLRLESVLTAS